MRILHWFRKDLRLDDNTALSEAAHDGDVIPFYTSEPALLGRPDMAAARVRFALDSLAALDDAIRACGSALALAHGDAAATVVAAARVAQADAVYWNDEYEPSLRLRDDTVEASLRAAGVRVKRFHDRLIVAPGAVATQQGGPFSVYTPFRKACEAQAMSAPHPPVTRFATHALPTPKLAPLGKLGFDEPAAARWPGGESEARARLAAFLSEADGDSPLARYGEQRDVPSVRATSCLSADLKFGTIGIRRIVADVRAAAAAQPSLRASADKYVSELRWRDFFTHVLWHWPHVEKGAFRPMYDALAWRDDEAQFEAWTQGRTGYPIVDAGMRELLATGIMHNRVRMIVASFLTKDLLLNWQLGERHFMKHLVDGDLAANNGGWQWAAGTGTDAAPYFRIFNPTSQGLRFDPDGAYVKRWCPELAAVPAAHVHAPATAPPLLLAGAGVTLGETYPFPIVDHAVQREACLAMYRAVRPDVA